MYRSHYGLIRKPFQLSTDPAFFWLGEKHKEALATLKYGVMDQKGFLLVSGDVGTGKTTLINALLETLDDSVLAATVRDPAMDLIGFYNYIALSFQIPGPFTSKVDFLAAFSDFLNKAYRSGRTLLLIIDEAHSLSREVLEHIRLLSNIEKPDEKLISIFFVGQNEIHDTLSLPECRALRQRISLVYHIDPLSEKETAAYIAYRLGVAGARRSIFTHAAVREIHHVSMGYPRMINTLCDHALVTGYIRDKVTIPPSIITECAQQFIVLNRGVNDGVFPAPVRPHPYGVTRQAPSTPGPARPVRTAPPSDDRHQPVPRTKRWIGLTAACLALLMSILALVYRMRPDASGTSSMPPTAVASPAGAEAAASNATPADTASNGFEPLSAQARNALDHKDYSRAIPLYRQIIAQNAPDLRPDIRIDYSRALRGQADLIAGQYPDQARELLTAAVDIDPRHGRAHFDLGRLWTESNNHVKAVQAYRAAADLAFRPCETYYNLGYSYAALKKFSLAEQMFRQAAALNPPYLDKALFNLAVVQHRQGKKQPCIDNLEKALKHNPGNLKAKGYLTRLQPDKDMPWISAANATP
ncbi:hypothetical protein JCM14469_37220 [Desulfatiferula olefinivorans]